MIGCTISCKQSEKNSTATIIQIDLKKLQQVNIQGEYTTQICLMDNGNPALVDEVKKILSIEGQYIIQCKNKVLAFDAQTGIQKMSFSDQGRAKDEFINLWDIWAEKDKICIYDMNSKKILQYYCNGNLFDVITVTSEAENHPFQALAKVSDEHYVGKCVYSGPESVELALYNNKFEFEKEFGNLNLESGIYLGYPFFMYKPNEILYYRYLYNDIYAIDDKRQVTVKYYIDFGKNNVPLNPDLKDEYDRIDFVNNSKKNYATFVSNIYESNKYFCFRFAFDGERCLGVYDKSSGEASAFTFISSSESPRADVYVFDDKALLITQDMDKTCLTTISVAELLKHNG